MPKTQKALATELGISEETIRNRKKEPRFQREMQAKLRGMVRVESLPDVLAALYTQALHTGNPRSVAASKLLLDFAATVVGEGPTRDLSEVPAEELIDAAMKVLAAASGVKNEIM